MKTDQTWIVVRIDGKYAAISKDYMALAQISAKLAKGKYIYKDITAQTISFDEILRLKDDIGFEDLMLFGTDFQKKVWQKLWTLTHSAPSDNVNTKKRLLSYSDFAELCDNRAGVRAVAHAVGLNPLPIIIPCHLIVPKESIDKIMEIRKKAEATIFKGEDLCFSSILGDSTIDFGEYSLGKKLKRWLIETELTQGI